ncbi:MAG: hypothetical protein V9H26_25780 [Verrucomicrobiota bacterium]
MHLSAEKSASEQRRIFRDEWLIEVVSEVGRSTRDAINDERTLPLPDELVQFAPDASNGVEPPRRIVPER